MGWNPGRAVVGAACTLALVAGMSAAGVAAHHAFTQFDQGNTITVAGVVSRIDWTNPHSWVWVDVKDDKGVAVNWGFEGGSVRQMYNAGYTRQNLKPGLRVVIEANPAKDGTPHGSLRSTTFEDGQKFGRGFGAF